MFFPEVRSERKRRGWSQQRLASEAGLSLPTIVQAEAGRRISFESAYKLAMAFERAPVPEESALEAAEA